jgi:hypothetical protein
MPERLGPKAYFSLILAYADRANGCAVVPTLNRDSVLNGTYNVAANTACEANFTLDKNGKSCVAGCLL